jgi:hypothetical protein
MSMPFWFSDNSGLGICRKNYAADHIPIQLHQANHGTDPPNLRQRDAGVGAVSGSASHQLAYVEARISRGRRYGGQVDCWDCAIKLALGVRASDKSACELSDEALQ